MKNIILQERINYWKKEYPNRKFLEPGSPLYLIINEADQTPGISWLTPEELINFVDESTKSFMNLASKGLYHAESESKPELIKPVIDLMRKHRDKIIDSEISGDAEILIGGIREKITKDEVIRNSLRMNKILRTRNDVVEVLKDLISYKRNLYKLHDKENSQPEQVVVPTEKNKSKRKPAKFLFEAFETTSKYNHIMGLLVESKYCNVGNYFWINEKDSNLGTIIYLLKYLHTQGYYKENRKLTNNEIIEIAQNTFGVKISESYAKQCKLTDKSITKLIPLASTIK